MNTIAARFICGGYVIVIDVGDAEKALEYLKNTDKEAARAKAYLNSMEDMKKSVIALIFCNLKGSAAERTQQAYAHDKYSEHLEKIKVATEEFESLRNQRKSAEIQVDMWRSINSNMRKGNI